MIHGENNKSWKSSLWNFLRTVVPSYLLLLLFSFFFFFSSSSSSPPPPSSSYSPPPPPFSMALQPNTGLGLFNPWPSGIYTPCRPFSITAFQHPLNILVQCI